MSEKVDSLIQLKKNIDKLSNSYTFNMGFDYENLVVDLNKDGKWEETSHLIMDSRMRGVPIYDGNSGYTIVNFIGPKGGIVKEHTHNHDEILICLRGMFRYVKNHNEHAIIKPLESVYIKKGLLHYVELLEDSEILTIWSPTYNDD